MSSQCVASRVVRVAVCGRADRADEPMNERSTACVVCGRALDPAGTVALPSDPAYGAFHHLEAEAARRDKDDAAVDQVGSLYPIVA